MHFEIPFDDGERARAVLRNVFGWEIMRDAGDELHDRDDRPTDPGKGPTESGFINGGMIQRRAISRRPIVIDVANIEDALKAVGDGGGTVVQSGSAVGDMGFAAYFKDTEGNLVGLWETKQS